MSDQKEITIVVPDGYEIDKVKSTFEKIVFKKKGVELPMSWEDLDMVHGYSISGNSGIYEAINCPTSPHNKNVFPSYGEANAMLAMSQLCQLRDAWNGDWKPDWFDSFQYKYVIYNFSNKLNTTINYQMVAPMYFKTAELRDNFLVKFAELLEIAKPFL